MFKDYLAEIETAAMALAVQSIRAPVRNSAEIEQTIEAFAAEPNGGLIFVPPRLPLYNRRLIYRLAVQRKLPIVEAGDISAEDGLISYGPNYFDLFRSAVSYVGRILRGDKVSDLPVQFPSMFELVVNLRTAAAMGLSISHHFSCAPTRSLNRSAKDNGCNPTLCNSYPGRRAASGHFRRLSPSGARQLIT